MKISVLYFAAVRDLVGRDDEVIDVPSGVISIASLRAHLEGIHPELAGRLGSVRFARNEEFSALGDAVAEGDTVALIPPVAGG